MSNNSEETPANLKSIYKEAELPMFVISVRNNNELRFEGINRAHEKVSGLKNKDVKGKTPEELTGLSMEAQKTIRSNYEKCIKKGKAIQYREMISVFGKETHWLTKLTPQKNSGGEIYRLVGTAMLINDLVETQQELEIEKKLLQKRVKKQAEELKQSEEKRRAVFESATDAYIIASLEGKIIEVNPSACKIYGYTCEEMIGKTTAELIHPNHHSKFPELIQSIKEHGMYKGETVDIRKDGSEFHTEIFGSSINFNNRNHLLVIVRDVSEKKEFLYQLEAEKKFTDAVINAMPGVFYMFDQNGKLLKWNNALADLSGSSIEEMNEKYPLDFIAEHHREEVEKAINSAFETGTVMVEADFKSKGKSKPFLFSGKIIQQNNEPLLVGIGIDIAKRANAEREREKTLHDLNERMKEITCLFKINEAIKNPEISIPDVMSKITRIIPTGWHYPENTNVKVVLKNQEFTSDNFKESDSFLEEPIFANTTKIGKIQVSVFDLNKKQKKQSFLPEEKKLLSTIANNIGIYVHRVESSRILEVALENMQRSNQELEQFAYVASHDLQEPLRMVSSYSQLLQRRYKGQLDERADKYIYYAVDGANRMQNLINDLLDFSRISTRGEKFIKTDTNEALQNSLNILSGRIKEKEAQINVGKLPVINADSGQMERLFLNLIGNALKFSKADEKPIIEVNAKSKKDKWLFSIKDNGIGIDEKFQEKVFVIFQRLHGSSQYKGTGIGLAICKRIVQRHGGDLWFESEEGKGTTFFFTVKKHRKN